MAIISRRLEKVVQADPRQHHEKYRRLESELRHAAKPVESRYPEVEDSKERRMLSERQNQHGNDHYGGEAPQFPPSKFFYLKNNYKRDL